MQVTYILETTKTMPGSYMNADRIEIKSKQDDIVQAISNQVLFLYALLPSSLKPEKFKDEIKNINKEGIEYWKEIFELIMRQLIMNDILSLEYNTRAIYSDSDEGAVDDN